MQSENQRKSKGRHYGFHQQMRQKQTGRRGVRIRHKCREYAVCRALLRPDRKFPEGEVRYRNTPCSALIKPAVNREYSLFFHPLKRINRLRKYASDSSAIRSWVGPKFSFLPFLQGFPQQYCLPRPGKKPSDQLFQCF